MALFKEENCAYCGKKLGMLSKHKLGDGTHICGKCYGRLPYTFLSGLKEYDKDQFAMVMEYLDESKNHLANIFHETDSYLGIHIDTQHELFYLDMVSPTVYLKFEQISEYDLYFEADEAKEGIFSTKVIGKIYLKLKTNFPVSFIDTVLATNVKASARTDQGIFRKKVIYDNPKGMNEFNHHFIKTWETAREKMYIRLTRELEEQQWAYEQEQEQSYSEPVSAVPSELQQAMALFMIDDLSSVTLSDIKAQRNRLIKSFHPDLNSSDDTGYAQKINLAYEVLKAHFS